MSKPRSIVDRFLAKESISDIAVTGADEKHDRRAYDRALEQAEETIRRAQKKARRAEAAMAQADLVIQRLMAGCESEVLSERRAAFEFCQEAYEPNQPLGRWANGGGRK